MTTPLGETARGESLREVEEAAAALIAAEADRDEASDRVTAARADFGVKAAAVAPLRLALVAAVQKAREAAGRRPTFRELAEAAHCSTSTVQVYSHVDLSAGPAQ